MERRGRTDQSRLFGFPGTSPSLPPSFDGFPKPSTYPDAISVAHFLTKWTKLPSKTDPGGNFRLCRSKTSRNQSKKSGIPVNSKSGQPESSEENMNQKTTKKKDKKSKL